MYVHRPTSFWGQWRHQGGIAPTGDYAPSPQLEEKMAKISHFQNVQIEEKSVFLVIHNFGKDMTEKIRTKHTKKIHILGLFSDLERRRRGRGPGSIAPYRIFLIF